MLETTLKHRDVFWRMYIPVNPQVEPDPQPIDIDMGSDGELESAPPPEIEYSGTPSDADWKVVEGLVVFLREFKLLTDQVSGSLYVASNSSFFYIARALDQLNKWTNSDVDFRLMAKEMKNKFDKYWGNIEKMNVLIYMGAILDPKVKLVGVKFVFTRMYGAPKDEALSQRVYQKASDLFDEYRRIYAPLYHRWDDTTPSTTHAPPPQQSSVLDFKKAIEDQVRLLRSDDRYARSKFDRYLHELGKHELEGDILTWWSLNAYRYPVLACLARDVLAMPISTVASESAFSTRGRHLDQFRSSLTPKMVQALICTQDWIRPKKDKEEPINVEEKLEDLEAIENEVSTMTEEPEMVFVSFGGD